LYHLLILLKMKDVDLQSIEEILQNRHISQKVTGK